MLPKIPSDLVKYVAYSVDGFASFHGVSYEKWLFCTVHSSVWQCELALQLLQRDAASRALWSKADSS